MDYRTYQQIRTYCYNDLREYLNLPGYDAMRRVWLKSKGQIGLIQREQQIANSLHQCSDLTPRERAAAELLAVISNHRVIAWRREPNPPNGEESRPPLKKIEADAMANQTRSAVRRYAAFLPEPEREILITDCEAALEAPAAEKVEAEENNKPLQRQQFQEQEILRIIRRLGHDPKNLPKGKAGTPGIRSAVRAELCFSNSVFNKAWERLRSYKAIKDAE